MSHVQTLCDDRDFFPADLVRAGKNTDDESNYAPFYATHGRTLKTNDVFPGDDSIQGFYSRHENLTLFVILSLAGIGGVGGLRVLRLMNRRFRPSRHL